MATADQFSSDLCESLATIPASTSIANAVDLAGTVAIGLAIPTPFTGTVAYFQDIGTDGVARNIYDSSGNQIAVHIAAGYYIPLDKAAFMGVRQLVVMSNATEGSIRDITVRSVPHP